MQVSVDVIEDALIGSGFAPSWESGVAAYEAARAIAEQNLVLGRTVVVDAVNDSEAARETWRCCSARTGARLVCVLLALDDQVEHRRRLEGRVRDLTNIPEPTWEDVERRAAAFEPWRGECHRVDAAAPFDVVTRTTLDDLPAH